VTPLWLPDRLPGEVVERINGTVAVRRQAQCSGPAAAVG
jgi:hypothetical protein